MPFAGLTPPSVNRPTPINSSSAYPFSQMGGLMNNYFSAMKNLQAPKASMAEYLIPAGSALLAASGPSTDPSAFSRGLGAAGMQIGKAAQDQKKRKAQLDMFKAKMAMDQYKLAMDMAKPISVPRGSRLINPLTGQPLSGAPMDETMAPDKIMTQERQIREGFEKATKDFRAKIDQYSGMEAIYNDPTQVDGIKVKLGDEAFTRTGQGAADLALIFNFMKMLDPRSVVREGEFTQARQTGSISDTLMAEYKKLVEGGELNKNTRRAIMAQARNQFDNAQQEIQRILQTRRGMASQYSKFGVVPNRALTYEGYQPRFPRSAFGRQKIG